MIRNNLIYGFNENGVIGYTKNAIGDMSVLVHEYAHTYFNEHNGKIDTLKINDFLSKEEYKEEFGENVRFEHLFEDYENSNFANIEEEKLRIEHFATAMGVTFKKIQDKLPTYKSAEDMRKNLVKDVESVCSEELKAKEGYSIFIDVIKSMCGKQQQVKSAKTITMKDIKEQAKKVCETGTEQDAFVQGAIWALKQSGIKVEEKIETPKEEKPKKTTISKNKDENYKDYEFVGMGQPKTFDDWKKIIGADVSFGEYHEIYVKDKDGKLKQIGKIVTDDMFYFNKAKKDNDNSSKATAKKATKKAGKPKKATKKAKVADKPKYEIGTIFEDDSIVIGYKNGKYQVVTKNDELVEMTEKEIDEA